MSQKMSTNSTLLKQTLKWLSSDWFSYNLQNEIQLSETIDKSKVITQRNETMEDKQNFQAEMKI